jgi:hypothetical protein
MHLRCHDWALESSLPQTLRIREKEEKDLVRRLDGKPRECHVLVVAAEGCRSFAHFSQLQEKRVGIVDNVLCTILHTTIYVH